MTPTSHTRSPSQQTPSQQRPSQQRLSQPTLEQQLSDFILGDHPCVMAKSMVNRDRLRVGRYGRLGDAARAAEVCQDLYDTLAASQPHAEADGSQGNAGPPQVSLTPSGGLTTEGRQVGGQAQLLSFVAAFDPLDRAGEAAFEAALWRQLQAMHEVDRQRFGWDPAVASDPGDARFSMSLGGVGWYVVGMHPGASRLARRFSQPLLVFNRHAQFELLRAQGRFEDLRDRIRARDKTLQGSVNPSLQDHGDSSEARQYAGRQVGDDWRCPFHPNTLANPTG